VPADALLPAVLWEDPVSQCRLGRTRGGRSPTPGSSAAPRSGSSRHLGAPRRASSPGTSCGCLGEVPSAAGGRREGMRCPAGGSRAAGICWCRSAWGLLSADFCIPPPAALPCKAQKNNERSWGDLVQAPGEKYQGLRWKHSP